MSRKNLVVKNNYFAQNVAQKQNIIEHLKQGVYSFMW